MDIPVGSRVTYGTAGKTGTLRYVGEVDSLSGEWAGIELDKPEGKHTGELNGRVYFTCPENHGVFVKRAQVRALGAPRTGGTGASPTSTGAARSATASSRFGVSAGSTSTTASRLQQMRDRRASAIGTTGSSSSIRSTASSSSSSATPSAVSPGTRESSRLSLGGAAATSALRRTPSMASSTSASSRLSTDSSARRLSMGRAAPPLSTSSVASTSTSSAAATAAAAASEELAEAKARIAKLEEDLEDRDRHVEQLKQNLVALRESHDRVASAQAPQAVTEEVADEEDPHADAMEVDDSGENDERVWLDKIEAVRKEAEDHVRAVRAELEDHIAQIQSEHEELVDELRLENATQNSEIKSLEAEIAQQKTRLAQFTSAEQKKAEEVALAMAKTSAGARKVESLETQISELQEMVETLTLEKETLEMDKEIAEERVEELVAEVEKLKTSIALASSTPHVSHSGSSSDVTEENFKLRAAIKALHDRSSEEKNELNKKVRQLQRETTELHNLREEVEQLASKKTTLEGEVEELKEQLDVANAYESMVEDLTEKNLTLGEKVAELETAVGTLESLKELSEEVEHQQNEYVAELTTKIETQQARMQELKNAIAEQKTVIEDKDRTIARFRDATNRSREDMNLLKAQLRAETGELESLKGTAHSALNQTMALRNLAATARENEAEAARQRINANQARVENSFLRAAIPSSILSEMDQKVLRVRLRLGRISGKADILLQYLRRDLDAIAQQDPNDTASLSVLDSERTIQQLLLGEKLANLSCAAKEDLFVLECHLTTSDEYSSACSRLDTNQSESLEAVLDVALTALADSTLFVSRSGEASTYNRLVASVDDWALSCTNAIATDNTEGFSARCAVVKYRAKRSVLNLSFSFAEMLTFIRTVKAVVMNPETSIPLDSKQSLRSLLDRIDEEYAALLKLAQHLHRRADMDLAWSDEDLDGSVAVGGEVVELLYATALESHNLWNVVQDRLSIANFQTPGSLEEIASFAEGYLLATLSSLKERLASLFKSVCRGSFIDAVSSRSRDRIDLDSGKEGRPQWQIRAQAIQRDLLNASSLQASLKETNELSQLLHNRVRELERADSQHRVVAQKLESDVLRLNDALGQMTKEKTRLEEQLAREREQFNIALDESHKDKAALDNSNRELRKQLKRSSDIGASSMASMSSSRNKSALNQNDADAFRKAFQHLHCELHRVRATLAKERLDNKLGSARPLAAELSAMSGQPSERLVRCAKEVSQFARQVKAQLSMPRMVDLSQKSSAREQLMQRKLEHAQIMKTLTTLRTRISSTVLEDGWNGDVVKAIDHGENVFGWRPPEMERPPVFLGRVTLLPLRPHAVDSADYEMEDIHAATPAHLQLILNQSQVKRLTQTLVC